MRVLIAEGEPSVLRLRALDRGRGRVRPPATVPGAGHRIGTGSAHG